jgi:hypothetical protein
MKGREDALPDAGRLNELGVEDKCTLFMLQREGECLPSKRGGIFVLLIGMLIQPTCRLVLDDL